MTPLDTERGAARRLREAIVAALGEDDETLDQVVADAIEGETRFAEVALRLAREARAAEAFAEGMKAIIAEDKERKERFENKAERIRRAIAAAMLDLGLKSLPGPLAVSARLGAPGVLIVSEDMLPPWAFRERVIREPNLSLIKETLARGEFVAGAVQTNGLPILIIRTS